MDDSSSKTIRLLSIYERLQQGSIIRKKEEAGRFRVNEKTIQRDIEDLRAYLAKSDVHHQALTINYDRGRKGYILFRDEHVWLTNEEILTISKILLESRALSKEEMEDLLDKLSMQTVQENRKFIRELVRNERFHYAPPRHQKKLIQQIWEVSEIIRQKLVISLTYQRVGQTVPKVREVFPVGLIFSEYYFYLIAYLKGYDFDFPTIYRLDRIQHYEETSEHFFIPEHERFEEGQFRKRIPFMQSGKLLKVTFRFFGPSLEAALDRLPHAKVLSQKDGEAVLEVEVFGGGIKMWLLSQLPYIEVLAPLDFREEISKVLEESWNIHNKKGFI